MRIRCTTQKSAITTFFRTARKILDEEITRTLSYLCEQCVVRVKDRDAASSWEDQTGNLRSSVGYAVYNYGIKQIQSAFEVVKEGTTGAREGKKMVEELAKQYSETYVALVVAAMSYAEYVENRRDVLASTETWAITKIDSYVAKARDRAIKKINALKL